MSDYLVKVDFDPRSEPVHGAGRLSPRVMTGATLTAKEGHAAGIGLKWLEIGEVDGSQRNGWVHLDWLRRLDEQGHAMTEAERDAFCARVTAAARSNLVDRDYLMAVAHCESGGINNVKSKSSSAFGPFQFTSATWADLVKEFGAETGITLSMRFEWHQQPTMAAILTRSIETELTKKFGRLSKLDEIYFGHVFGRAGAATLLAQDRTRSFESAYEDAFPGKSAAVRKGNPFVESNSIEEVLKELGSRLDKGFFGALPIIDRMPDDIRFVHAEAGQGPPWLRVAREELSRGVREIPGVVSEPRIVKYHELAGGLASTDEVPWCGAFVAFCLKMCGDGTAAASVVRMPRRAASWKVWGQASPDPSRLGAIVVLSPQTRESSGHVGFLVDRDATHVTLLGGNQSDAVSEKRYPINQVVETRILS